MKRIFFLIGLFFLVADVCSQTSTYDAKLPDILPPSPEPFAFVKAGMGNVNMSSGAITSSISLYDIKMKSVTIPLSINYTSQGLKLDEIPSRVGMGWTLMAGGVINRTVRGAPDDESIRLAEPNDFFANTAEYYAYLDNASKAAPDNDYDTQPDEYQFSFNGYSGKFVFNQNNQAVIISHSNLKINGYQNNSQFIITTPDGVKYHFGYNNAFEKTITTSMAYYSTYTDRIKTAFFLTKIEAPNGESINFTYNNINILTKPSITHTITNAWGTGGNISCLECPTPQTIIQNDINISTIRYDSRYLNSIETSSGVTINFLYQNRPDASNDVRLIETSIAYSGIILKKYNFTYFDPTNIEVSGTNKRFFLSKIGLEEKDVTTNNIINREHVFNYYNLENLPSRLTFSQDHWGFYNGQNNATFIPYQSSLYAHSSSIANANRNAYWNFSQTGTLKSITYPTGGIEEFSYEGNTAYTSETLNTQTIQNISGIGGGSLGGTINPNTYLGTQINSLRDQTIQISATTKLNPYFTGNPILGSYYDRVSVIKVKDLTTNIYSFTATIYDYTTQNFTTQFIANHNYIMELYVYGGEQNAASFYLSYNYSQNDSIVWVNKPVGGIRLKQIQLIDPVSKNVTNKFFKYTSLQNQNLSSGIASLMGIYFRETYNGLVSSGEIVTTCPIPLCASVICTNHTFSSNSIFSLFNYDGNHIYYKTILTSNDSTFSNGVTENEFYNPSLARTDQIIIGQDVPGAYPTMNYPVFNGVLKKETLYNNQLQKIQEKTNYYDYYDTIISRVSSIAVNRRYKSYYFGSGCSDVWAPFDVIKYDYQSLWLRQDSAITKYFDSTGNVSTNQLYYTYGTPNNILPKELKTMNSLGNETKNQTLYPTDFSSDFVFSNMISKNNIAEPIDEFSYNNGVLTSRRKKEFIGLSNNLFVPSIIKLQTTTNAALENEIFFNQYDNVGNPLELRKADDVVISYIWGYNGLYPIAEVKNASLNSIAYTSFETDDYGNWQIVSGNTNNVGFCGLKSFTGTLTKTINISGNYVVSLWTNSTATVNGFTGNELVNKNGWKLLKWVITNPSTITISGYNLDELRLQPEKSQMLTYTFKPNIGLSSNCDVNNIPTYYEYDVNNKLKLIRDADRNIIKQYEYVFQEQIRPCLNSNSDWQATGNKRCVKGANNNNTGIEEKEERDMNNCSPNYLHTRWVSLGVTGNCNPIPNCIGNEKRVVNNVCETGIKLVIGSTFSNGMWTCTFYYQWTDGFTSDFFTETSATTCLTTINSN